MKAIHSLKFSWRLLPSIVLVAVAAAITSVNAAGPRPLQEQSARAPFAVYPGDRSSDTAVEAPSRIYRRATAAIPVHEIAGITTQDIGLTEANQIGINREVNMRSNRMGAEYANPDGTKLRMIAIRSTGAYAVRIRFDKFNLQPGDEVFVRGASGRVAGPYKGKGPFGDGEFWADLVGGDTAIIEHLIRDVGSSFEVASVSHIYAEAETPTVSPQLLSCEVDASCGFEAEKNAVARIIYSKTGGTFVCSATLLNNLRGDFTPFLLTANHCVSTSEVARTVQPYFFYQTTNCDGSTLQDVSVSAGGADLLATLRTADQTLLRLSGSVPGGVVFAGWDSTAKTPGVSVYGLHHPGGGVPPSMTSFLRRSAGLVTTFANCPPSGLLNGYWTEWSVGVTEPGSSGSGLFVSGFGLVGVLSCGPAVPTCNEKISLYGRFSDFYPLVQTFLEQGGGSSCVTDLQSAQLVYPATAGTGAAAVVAPGGCQWSAQSSASWLQLTGPTSGHGSATINFSLTANPETTSRNATITVQGRVISIVQGGVGCNFAASSTTQTFEAFGGNGTVSLAVSGACSWNASLDVDWITITSGSSGTGTGTIGFWVAPHTGSSSRTGRISAGGSSIEITQTSGPVITGAVIQGKKLIIAGANFGSGASLFVNGVKQKKVKNDGENPTTTLIGKKSGKDIDPGQTVNIQIENIDGKRTQLFAYTRPGGQ